MADSPDNRHWLRRFVSKLLAPIKLVLLVLYLLLTAPVDSTDPEVTAAAASNEPPVTPNEDLTDPEPLPSAPAKFTTSNITDYSPIEFEHLVAHLYEFKGYDCGMTADTGDHGADVIARGDHDSVSIQVKRYAPGKVAGGQTVRDADAGQSYYNTKRAAAVTSSTFSRGAKVFAEIADVELVEGDELVDELNAQIGPRQKRGVTEEGRDDLGGESDT